MGQSQSHPTSTTPAPHLPILDGIFGGAEAPPPPPPPDPAADDDTLLSVLDKLAHDSKALPLLHAFVSKYCELFKSDEADEQPLVATEVHQSYRLLFERCLADVLQSAGLSEEAFAALMGRAVARPGGSEAAELVLDFAAAADEYPAFASLMRARRRQCGGTAAAATAAQMSPGEREELRAHIWGLQRKLRRALGADADGAAATGAGPLASPSLDSLSQSLDGLSHWLQASSGPDALSPWLQRSTPGRYHVAELVEGSGADAGNGNADAGGAEAGGAEGGGGEGGGGARHSNRVRV